MRSLSRICFAIVFACVFNSGLVSSAFAEPLSFAKPEAVGISSSALERINDFTREQVENDRHAGFVTMVARHGKIVHFETRGTYGLDNDKPMDKDALFRIYSMTKPITSVAVMMLYEEGRFQLTDPVVNYIPEFSRLKLYEDEDGSFKPKQITIEQLLTHTAGFSYGFAPDHPVNVAYLEAELLQSTDSQTFIDRLADIPVRFKPGSRYYYSVATDVLGILVERVSGQSLDVFFQERIFTPLGMKDSGFAVADEDLPRLTSNHIWDPTNQQMVLLSPEQQRFWENSRFFSGGGGLVSTAMDYMIFCEMLRRGGSYNGVRILAPKTVAFMTMNHLTNEVRNHGADEYPSSHLYNGQSFGLGFGVITEPGISGVISSKGEYSWGGAADTKFWIDPEEDLVVILMTQLLRSPWETRYRLKVATYQALTQLGKPE